MFNLFLNLSLHELLEILLLFHAASAHGTSVPSVAFNFWFLFAVVSIGIDEGLRRFFIFIFYLIFLKYSTDLFRTV
jgi:hypothetical protein